MEHVWQLKRKWDIGTLRSDLLMVSRYEKSVNTDCPKPQELTGIRANHLPLCEHSDSFYCLCWCRIFLFSWPIQGTFWHWDLLLTGCHGVWIKKHCSWDFTGTLSRIGVIRTRTCLVAQWLRFCLPMQGVQVWFLVRELRSHMPQGVAKKVKKKKKRNQSAFPGKNCGFWGVNWVWVLTLRLLAQCPRASYSTFLNISSLFSKKEKI